MRKTLELMLTKKRSGGFMLTGSCNLQILEGLFKGSYGDNVTLPQQKLFVTIETAQYLLSDIVQ